MSVISSNENVIDFSGPFALSDLKGEHKLEAVFPGDVHSALLENKLIPDPYYGNNELDVLWVSKRDWVAERTIDVPATFLTNSVFLSISEIDCVAKVYLNDQLILQSDNQFLKHDVDVTQQLKPGPNTLRIYFANAHDEAQKRFDEHPYPIPYAQMNQPNMAHINFLRKTACHGGWDWGICLMPIGVYGEIKLHKIAAARLDSVQVEQEHTEGAVKLSLSTRIHAVAKNRLNLVHKIDGQTFESTHEVESGENILHAELKITDPQIWWPAGDGDQPLYELTTQIDNQSLVQHIGLRKLEWIVENDEIDQSFKCRINDRDIFARGANWIPLDALPSRIDRKGVRAALLAAQEANMNMIRVWGGGQYEPDYFYELCDELGLLVWQDFMFSCMPYPTHEPFLASVREEITQQVRRLQHHACIAIWCGDNEVIGSLNWYEETKANRDRFVANYDRLSHLLQTIVAKEDPNRRFWPSSPSLGYQDFADGWHTDTRGDMHFWDVWHSAKPFSAYRDVQPRFASEFGFQSFTSMDVIKSFAEPQDFNPSSPVMETHQRNDGGNARILETMCRYFRFPQNFEQMVYLSQVQQGLAIKTAIEFWRSTKPRCMGTLFWQLNDTWPVHSWSSLDYGGGWKQLHYMAKRFFQLVNFVAVPTKENTIEIRAINDSPDPVNRMLQVFAINMQGTRRQLFAQSVEIETHRATVATELDADTLNADEFLYFEWSDDSKIDIGANDYFPRAHKYYDLPNATISSTWRETNGRFELEITTDQPAFFVTARVAAKGHFSENAITLLPDQKTVLTFFPDGKKECDLALLQSSLQIDHLRETY